jgi:hypothetical protein
VLEVLAEEKDDRGFVLVSTGRPWHLRAVDAGEKDMWVTHFRGCVEIAYQCILKITRSSFGTFSLVATLQKGGKGVNGGRSHTKLFYWNRTSP